MTRACMVLVVALAISATLAIQDRFVEVKSKQVVDLRDQGEAVDTIDGKLMEEPMDEQELEMRAGKNTKRTIGRY